MRWLLECDGPPGGCGPGDFAAPAGQRSKGRNKQVGRHFDGVIAAQQPYVVVEGSYTAATAMTMAAAVFLHVDTVLGPVLHAYAYADLARHWALCSLHTCVGVKCSRSCLSNAHNRVVLSRWSTACCLCCRPSCFADSCMKLSRSAVVKTTAPLCSLFWSSYAVLMKRLDACGAPAEFQRLPRLFMVCMVCLHPVRDYR